MGGRRSPPRRAGLALIGDSTGSICPVVAPAPRTERSAPDPPLRGEASRSTKYLLRGQIDGYRNVGRTNSACTGTQIRHTYHPAPSAGSVSRWKNGASRRHHSGIAEYSLSDEQWKAEALASSISDYGRLTNCDSGGSWLGRLSRAAAHPGGAHHSVRVLRPLRLATLGRICSPFLVAPSVWHAATVVSRPGFALPVSGPIRTPTTASRNRSRSGGRPPDASTCQLTGTRVSTRFRWWPGTPHHVRQSSR